MRKLFILLLLALSGQIASAQNRLVVQAKNGNTMFFTLAQEPRVHFERDHIEIYYEYDCISFLLADFDSFYYDDGNGNAMNKVNNDSWTVEEKDEQVIVHGLKEDTPVMLYNAAGQLLSNSKAEKGKPLSLSLQALPTGIYIIKAQQQTLKIKKQ